MIGHRRRLGGFCFYGIVFLVSLVLFAVPGCSDNEGRTVEDTRFLLHTVVTIKIWGTDDADILEGAFTLIEEYEGLLSRHIQGSDPSRLNDAAAGTAVSVGDPALEVVSRAIEIAELSRGAFDPTVGPLVDLWGIGTGDARIPGEAEIRKALSLVDFRRLEIDKGGSTLTLESEGMTLDLGGIAKGWIADRVGEYFREAGEERFLVNLGGNILVGEGKPGNEPFRIGLQDPFDDRGSYLGIFTITDLSVVSSGIYERYFEEGGRRYHHILDTTTGYPVDNTLAAVTILSQSSADGDGLSTALFAMGIEDGLALVENLDGIEAVFVTHEKEITMTGGVEALYQSR